MCVWILLPLFSTGYKISKYSFFFSFHAICHTNQVVIEEIYMTLYKLDGERSAYELRKQVFAGMKKGSALSNYYDTHNDMGFEIKTPFHSSS